MSGPQSAPRITPLAPEELTEDALALATKLRAVFGLKTDALPEVVSTLLRHHEVYRAQIDFVAEKNKAMVLPARDLELMILRTAWLCQAPYTWGEHVNFAKKADITSEEIERVTQGSAAPGWNERDATVLKMAEELHESCNVCDKTWELVRKHFSDKEIIELLMTAGFYREIAYLYNTMRVNLIPGNPGLSAR